MIGIVQAFQGMSPEEIAVLVIVGCMTFVIGVALG